MIGPDVHVLLEELHTYIATQTPNGVCWSVALARVGERLGCKLSPTLSHYLAAALTRKFDVRVFFDSSARTEVPRSEVKEFFTRGGSPSVHVIAAASESERLLGLEGGSRSRGLLAAAADSTSAEVGGHESECRAVLYAVAHAGRQGLCATEMRSELPDILHAEALADSLVHVGLVVRRKVRPLEKDSGQVGGCGLAPHELIARVDAMDTIYHLKALAQCYNPLEDGLELGVTTVQREGFMRALLTRLRQAGAGHDSEADATAATTTENKAGAGSEGPLVKMMDAFAQLGLRVNRGKEGKMVRNLLLNGAARDGESLKVSFVDIDADGNQQNLRHDRAPVGPVSQSYLRLTSPTRTCDTSTSSAPSGTAAATAGSRVVGGELRPALNMSCLHLLISHLAAAGDVGVLESDLIHLLACGGRHDKYADPNPKPIKALLNYGFPRLGQPRHQQTRYFMRGCGPDEPQPTADDVAMGAMGALARQRGEARGEAPTTKVALAVSRTPGSRRSSSRGGGGSDNYEERGARAEARQRETESRGARARRLNSEDRARRDELRVVVVRALMADQGGAVHMGSEMVQAIVKAEGMPAKGGDGKLARKVAETMCDMGEVRKVTSETAVATAVATRRTHVFLVAKGGLLAVRQDSQIFTRI
jgi:hypothetical protein